MAEQLSADPLNAPRVRRCWHFAGSALDERTLVLAVSGVEVELERKPLEVLLYLLQHAGEVCTKDELLSGVWPGRILTETVLTKCIGRLREVLGDRDQDIIKTVYGFGYRLVAPVHLESSVPLAPATQLGFQPGDHPPGRPLWSLAERLGAGGHGEAWRAQHDKTREQRVFKFALDETSLSALKREITLFRVINDTLGERARVLRLLDWNLEQLPYFVETDFIEGGSLLDWVRSRGGALAIALPERLELVAAIAAAVADVHSVGVLHKDLKPSNILIRPAKGGSEVLLADFGSGGVLDTDHLERLGITRLGFTKTLSAAALSAATPLYLAPEVLSGQPFTVKADVYALGVILYQLLVGDFQTTLAPGWEKRIDDELLRQDIAQLAEGNPALRLADAAMLAKRLRTLEERRRQLEAEREAAAQAERASREAERARARRLGLALAFAMLVLGLAVSTAMYLRARSAQQRAETAAAQSKAVVEYLSNDVFAPASADSAPVKDLTVTQLLSRAGADVDHRFAGHPEIAAELHFIIGRSLHALQEAPLALQHFTRAMQLGEHLNGEGSEAAVRSAAELVYMDYLVGRLGATIGRYQAVLDAGAQRLGPRASAVLNLRLQLARGRYLLGEWARADRELQALLADIPSGQDARLAGEAELYDGQVLNDLADPAAAERQLRAAVSQLSAAVGPRHALVAESHSALGRALADLGRYTEATAELGTAQELATAWAPVKSWTAIRPQFFTALMLLRQDQPVRAEPLLATIVRYQDDDRTDEVQAFKGPVPELDHTGAVRQALGEAYAREGRLPEALAALQRAVAVSERADGPQHPAVVSARLSLAECLLAAGRDADARSEFAQVAQGALAELPAVHPILAQWYRVEGLLALHGGDAAQARKSLGTALDIDRALYGANQWRTQRASRELLLAAH
ncbi:MAG TPA: winged helix-turn-helix domain-containing protein [Steroidobacteraceae bacterium]|nr:winged helix-turn-helix domain-containing protein [Steroidobacteraceae bacterium]